MPNVNILQPQKHTPNHQPPAPQITPQHRHISPRYQSPYQTISSPSPASSRPLAARSLFSSRYKTSMGTSRQISSLLKNFETESEPDVREYLEQIDRQQKKCIAYHKLPLNKLDLIIDILTGSNSNSVPENPLTTDFLAPVTTPEVPELPVVPLLEQTITPDQQQTQQTSSTDHRETISQDKLFAIRSRATSVRNFAVLLTRNLQILSCSPRWLRLPVERL